MSDPAMTQGSAPSAPPAPRANPLGDLTKALGVPEWLIAGGALVAAIATILSGRLRSLGTLPDLLLTLAAGSWVVLRLLPQFGWLRKYDRYLPFVILGYALHLVINLLSVVFVGLLAGFWPLLYTLGVAALTAGAWLRFSKRNRTA